ncbi:C-type lectin domain family 4 member F-like isoform X2 [Mauremys mutica]|uniref:C-type lectin domain family 4 member F-like isoform X2 n=1 Tax=Mauremys mutica TaxID=74926 RepID=UPI001D15FBE4|nr:C-type lectin domain family 4 member F-like isoform X2 [Mauremys mutica]
MARDNIYENMPMTEAAPQPKGNPPQTSVPWRHRARGIVTAVLLLLGLALATSLLAVTLLCLQLLDEAQAGVQKLKAQLGNVSASYAEIQIRLDNVSAARAAVQGRYSDVLRKLFRGWRFYGGNLYYFSHEMKSWDEAEQFCVSQDSHLTSVSSQAEQEFLSNETKGQDHWIGLTDRETEGSWRWADGTEYRADASRGFWGENEPNNWDHGIRGREDCAEIYTRKLNLWNDANCALPTRWICKRTHGPAGM